MKLSKYRQEKIMQRMALLESGTVQVCHKMTKQQKDKFFNIENEPYRSTTSVLATS